MSTKAITLNFYQGFDSTDKTNSTDEVSIPAGTYWKDTEKKKLFINVFLMLEHKYQLNDSLRSPACDWELRTNTLALDFNFIYDPELPITNAHQIWYLQYEVNFNEAVSGDLTLLTSLSETTKVESNLLLSKKPTTKRGTTTTVQH